MTSDNHSSAYKQLFGIPKKTSFSEIQNSYFLSLNNFLTSGIGVVLAIIIGFIPSIPKYFVVVILGSTIIISYIIITYRFLLKKARRIFQLESNAKSLIKLIMGLSGFNNPDQFSDHTLEILGISTDNGFVDLVIKQPKTNWLNVGGKLDVLTIATNDLWGTVKITNFEEDRIFACPIDRKNPDFWENLEDRMYYDPSTPHGIYIEPHIPEPIRNLIEANHLQGDQNNGQ
jgi:hypothetical protein